MKKNYKSYFIFLILSVFFLTTVIGPFGSAGNLYGVNKVSIDTKPMYKLFPDEFYRIGIGNFLFNDFYAAGYVKDRFLKGFVAINKYEILESDLLEGSSIKYNENVNIGDRNSKTQNTEIVYDYKNHAYYKTDMIISGEILSLSGFNKKRIGSIGNSFARIRLSLYQPNTGAILWTTDISGRMNDIVKYVISIIERGNRK